MAIYNTDRDPNDLMWEQQQEEIEFQKFLDSSDMESNGYAYFDDKEFDAKSNKPCYIPENAETMEDVFSYRDLEKLVDEWLDKEDTQEALLDKGYTKDELDNVGDFVYNLYHSLEWQFPSTLLDEWAY